MAVISHRKAAHLLQAWLAAAVLFEFARAQMPQVLEPTPTPQPMAQQVVDGGQERMENYMPVQSPAQAQFQRLGMGDVTTPPPVRDCVRAPLASQCGCLEVVQACQRESYECEKSLKELSRWAPKVQQENFISKFDHPLLNTLSVGTRLRRGLTVRRTQTGAAAGVGFLSRRQSPVQMPVELPGQLVSGTPPPWAPEAMLGPPQVPAPPPLASPFGGMVRVMPTAAPQVMALGPAGQEAISMTPMPTFIGSATTPAPPTTIVNTTSEGCSEQGQQMMRDCLMYFWSCDRNKNDLLKNSIKLDHQTIWMDNHPWEPPLSR